MYRLVTITAAVLVALVQPGEAHLQWKSCTSSSSPLHVSRIDVEPTPIVVPGNLKVFVQGATTQSISHSTLHLTMQRKTFLINIPIPCIFHIGSCTYNDICSLLHDFEVNNYAGVTSGLAAGIRAMLAASNVNPDVCPNPVHEVNIDGYTLALGEVPAVLSWFAAGDYHVHVSLVDSRTNQETLCLDIEATVEQKCSGLSCLFG